MKKKKNRNIYFIIAGILLIIYLLINTFFIRDNENKIQVYKESAVNDCANYTNNVNDAIDFTKLVKSQNMVEDNSLFNFADYERSSCVELKGNVIKDYLILKDYPINHIKGQNNQAYQLSYEIVLDELKKIKKPNAMDEKMIDALEYFINNPYHQAEVNNDATMFKFAKLTGPAREDASGTYYPVIDLKILVNRIFSKENDELKLIDTKYTLDDIVVHYVKEA